jgi:hypothetical protein
LILPFAALTFFKHAIMTSTDLTEDDNDVPADETTALLAPPTGQAAVAVEDEEIAPRQDVEDDKPLPQGQIFLICFATIIEPVAFFCIFPYINQMIFETGEVSRNSVGKYSGLIVSVEGRRKSRSSVLTPDRNRCSL